MEGKERCLPCWNIHTVQNRRNQKKAAQQCPEQHSILSHKALPWALWAARSSRSPPRCACRLVVISTLTELSACGLSSLPPLAFYFLTHTVQVHCGGEEGVVEQSSSYLSGQEGEKRNPGGFMPRDRSRKMSPESYFSCQVPILSPTST